MRAVRERHDGVVVFGGPMGVNDDCEWIGREIAWLETPLREDKPLLGICLGAQMLARTLGARVFNYADRRGEMGYFPVRPDTCADALCAAPFPRHVYQWHCDGFELPEGAQLIAEGSSNKEIGVRLFISERTVDSHVRSILNKLGVNTRAQIAVWVRSAKR